MLFVTLALSLRMGSPVLSVSRLVSAAQVIVPEKPVLVAVLASDIPIMLSHVILNDVGHEEGLLVAPACERPVSMVHSGIDFSRVSHDWLDPGYLSVRIQNQYFQFSS